jgi:hypothetical protein
MKRPITRPAMRAKVITPARVPPDMMLIATLLIEN